jgi:hypothetical protein
LDLIEIVAVLDREFNKAIDDYAHYKKTGNVLQMHQAGAKAGAYSHAKSMLDSHIEESEAMGADHK